MDKKKILLLVGGVAVIVIVAVATQYLAMQNKNSGSPTDKVSVPPVTEESKVFFTSTSSLGTVQSINTEKVVISNIDGGTKEYVSTDFTTFYDNRVRDAMQPIKFEDIKVGMRVQISVSTNQSDKTETKSLTIYE